MDDHADFGQFLRVGVFLIGVVKGSTKAAKRCYPYRSS